MKTSTTTLKNAGFTLIEMIFAIAVVAILSAVAYPSYQEYAENTRRSEGAAALTRIMDLQERYYTNQFPPEYANLATLGMDDPFLTDNGYYSISAESCDGDAIVDDDGTQCVRLLAEGQGIQEVDGDLRINSRGTMERGEDDDDDWETVVSWK